MKSCPNCGEIKKWNFRRGECSLSLIGRNNLLFDKINPDEGCCVKCNFRYVGHYKHSLEEQLNEFKNRDNRAKMKKKCSGIGCNNIREKTSPSRDYCNSCYIRMKDRYANWQIGLRGLRIMTDRPRMLLSGFFAYCMPHVTDDRANEIIDTVFKRH
jgi:hypothetical protein